MTHNADTSTTPFSIRARSRRTGAALAVAVGLVLTGCSSASQSAAPAAADAAMGAPVEKFAAPPGKARGTTVKPATPEVPVTPVAPMLAKKASVSLEVADVSGAAARVRAVVAARGGLILEESIGRSSDGPVQQRSPGLESSDGYGSMTLSVPAGALEATLTDLAKVGTVVAQGGSSTDVTSEVIDTGSRLKTMRASVDRVRALMAQARDIGQIVALESELSRRQADLESLESQLAALKGRVQQATVSVSLTTPATAEATATGGFAAGLRAGWEAFVSSGRSLLTAVGAVLPFAVFFGLLLLPVVAVLRRRRAATPPA